MAEFNIGRFQETLQSGIRPNLFEVILGEDPEASSLLVTSASLPGRTLGTASAYYRGREIKLAGDMTFAPWSTTIINDSSMTFRSILENWMNSRIEDLENKTAEGNPDGSPAGYFEDIIVNQLDKAGEIIRSYRLVGAWPSDISDVPLSFDANDQISAFTCTWQYQYFTVGEGDEAPPSNVIG